LKKTESCKKLEVKHARKLKAYARQNGLMKNVKENFSTTCMSAKMHVPYLETEKIKKSRSEKNLSAPKGVPARRDLITRGELEDLFRHLHSMDVRPSESLPKCLEPKESVDIQDDSEEEIDDGDESYQHHVLVQKTIKGVLARSELLEGMLAKLDEIKGYRKKFPIRCVTELLPVIDEEEQEEQSVVEEETVTPSVDHHERETLLTGHMHEILTDIFDKSCQLGLDEWNRKLLKLANEERKKRQKLAEIEEIQQRIKEARSERIKSKVNAMYDEIVADLMEKIIPVVIEMIAEKDARRFIRIKAKEIFQSAFKNDVDSVDEILKKVLIPIITAELSKDTERLAALLGSCDALEAYLKENFTQ
jgi:hypothetical protein